MIYYIIIIVTIINKLIIDHISCVFLQVSVDTLSWEFIVSTSDDKNLISPPMVT